MTKEEAENEARKRSRLVPGALYRVAMLPTSKGDDWYVYRGLPGRPTDPAIAYCNGERVSGRVSLR